MELSLDVTGPAPRLFMNGPVARRLRFRRSRDDAAYFGLTLPPQSPAGDGFQDQAGLI